MAEFDPFKPITADDLGGAGEPPEDQLDDQLDDDGQVDLGEEEPDVGPDQGDLPGEEGTIPDDGQVDPIGDAAADETGANAGITQGDIPNEGDAGLKLDDLGADVPGAAPAPPEPQIKWTNVPQDNSDIWSEHVDGYVLRARALSAKNGDKTKYIAQLFKDKKLIEKGVVFIKSTDDAQAVLQNIADRILDKMGLVSHSLVQKQPPPAPGGDEGGDAGPLGDGEAGPTEADIPSGDEGNADASDLDLGDEDLEALGG